MKNNKIPKELIKDFQHKNVKFEVSIFEQYMLNDLLSHDEQQAIKLNRDVSNEFISEIKMYIKEKRNIRYSIKGETRCIYENEKILLSNFEYKKIKNCKVGENVFCINNKTNKIEKKPIIELWNNGEKELYEVKLSGGKKIKCTINHSFLIRKKNKNCWVELRNIKINDYIASPNKINYSIKTKYNLNEIELLGFYIGDGYSRNNHSKNSRVVVFDLSKEDKIDYFLKLINNTRLNYKVTRINYVRKNKNFKNGNKFTFSKKNQFKGKNKNNRIKDDFTQIIYDLNLIEKKAKNKFIPTIIKNSSNIEIYSLLSGLFNSDGYIDMHKKAIKYCTISKVLINDIKIILTKIGIFYTENKKISKKGNNTYFSYEISIQRLTELTKLYENCNFSKNKKYNLMKIIKSKTTSKKHSLYTNDLIFNKVKSIKKIGIGKTFDITIKNNHNYIANLFIVHNSGKSLSALKIGNIITNTQNTDFNKNINKIVCGNQIEYREKLKNAQFGDFYLVDENFFQSGGLGSNMESQQLKDYNSIIAKKNISVVFINPERFLSVGATLGFSTYGRDSKNWLSRMLLYKFINNFPHLIGYIVVDIGDMFRSNGCFLYKFIGGCNNTNKKNIKDIPKKYIKFSNCIPKSYDKEKILSDYSQCPFYNVCTHALCSYEKKKDSWINKEMTGGLDERTKERYELSLKLILELIVNVDIETRHIRLNAKNSKDLKNRIKLKVHKYSNTKMGIGEYDELIEIVKSNCAIDMLIETLKTINNKKLNELFFKLENGEIIKEMYDDDKKIDIS